MEQGGNIEHESGVNKMRGDKITSLNGVDISVFGKLFMKWNPPTGRARKNAYDR